MAIPNKLIIGSLVAATSLSAFVLTSTTASADSEPYSETYTKSALIRVQSACTLSGTESTPHTRSINPGTYQSNIGETIFSAVCNDAGGFAVYAIGYTGDTDGNNKLVHSTDSSKFINTGLAESGNDSAWAMKLTAVENDATPTIHGGYDNYSLVPDDYVKVASYPSVTTASTASLFKSYYAAYISLIQPAGIYNGQVKYVMVHPSTAAAPGSFDNAFAAAGKTKDATSNKYKMQDMNTSICSNVNNGQETELVDIRDGTVYHVGKMLDGRCWLLDNLALDVVVIKAVLSPDNTNATQAAIDNFIADSGTAPQIGWATTAVSYETNTSTYDQPRINVASKNVVPQGDDPLATFVSSGGWRVGIYYNYCAASIGTYCYEYQQGVDTDLSSAIDVKNDICPAGWRMPTGYSYNATTRPDGGEYQALYNAYPAISGGDNKYTRFRKAFRLPLSGFFVSGSPARQGDYANVWSSTFIGNLSMYNLYASTSYIDPQYNGGRGSGQSVRCIAKTANE